MSLNIALITDDPGWHGARLCEAFAARACAVQVVSLRNCAIDLVNAPHGLHIPGFEDRLPDGVFVRGVPGGSLEQVVLYLDILHVLKALSIPVYNDGRAIERSVDKGMTSLLLQQAGIPVPPTWVVSSRERGLCIWAEECAAGHSLVVKPLFGSQGQGLARLLQDDTLPALEDYQGVYYLQRFVEGQHFDWRAFVINGEVVACMQRHGRYWINSVAQGASCIAAPKNRELETLAEAATQVLDMDYAGVDLMCDVNGDFQVIEINSIPAWKGLQTTSRIDIARCLVDDFYSRYLARKSVMAVGE